MAARRGQNPFLDMLFGGQTWYNPGGGGTATASGAHPNSVNRTPTRIYDSNRNTSNRVGGSGHYTGNQGRNIQDIVGSDNRGGGWTGSTPNSNPSPNSNLNPNTAGLDDDLAGFTTAINDLINSGNAFNIGQRADAIRMLTGPGGFAEQVNSYYDPLIANTENALPLNPFSDALRNALLSRSNDLITTQGGGAFNAASGALASRGLSAGGTSAQTAAGGLISDMLNARIGAETGTKEAQLGFNTQANAARQSLLGQFTGQKTNALGQLETLASQIQAGNVIDPMASANVLGQGVTTQLSREDRDAMLEWIASQEPTMQDKLWGLIPLLGTMAFPGAQNVQAMLANIFGPSGPFGQSGNYSNPFGQPSGGFNVYGS